MTPPCFSKPFWQSVASSRRLSQNIPTIGIGFVQCVGFIKMTNSTFGSPELIQTTVWRRSPPAVFKIKRGGTGKVSNSGGNKPTNRGCYGLHLRDYKKLSKKHKRTNEYRQVPKLKRAPVIWNPNQVPS